MQIRRLLGFSCTLVFSLFLFTAHAANDETHEMNVGTWEVSTSSDLLYLVPSIPVQQMADIKNLAREYGFELPDIQNGAAITSTCITPEIASQKTLAPFFHAKAGCTTQNAKRQGNQYEMTMICASTEIKGNGKLSGELINAKTFVGHTEFNGVIHGNPINEVAQIQGRWIKSTCE